MRTLKCKCHPESPFHWFLDPRPSVFQKDAAFRVATTTGLSSSQVSTQRVEETRKKGQVAGFLRGISRKREEEVLRIRNFMIYSYAQPSEGPAKGEPDEVEGKKRNAPGAGRAKR